MLSLLLLACTTEAPVVPAPAPAAAAPPLAAPTSSPTRVLVVIADDLGIDALGSYADTSGVNGAAHPWPATPTLDGVCEGVRFRQAWANPTCTPTRGTVMTGQYGFRTGLDGVGRGYSIAADAATLPRALPDVSTALFGKWHLGHGDELGGASAPNQLGWDHFSGSLGNLDDYSSWEKTTDGATQQTTTYATTAIIDDAIAWTAARAPDEPWLLWVAFNAPHGPFHDPPAGLHRQGTIDTDTARYDAMVEAMDAELARLLAAVGDDVTIIFLGDNGTPGRMIRPPWTRDRAKGSLHEGGVRVPMCAAGPGVVSGTSDALVQSVDVFDTVIELFGAQPPADTDAVSLLPYLSEPGQASLRSFAYAEQAPGKRAGGVAIRNAQHKLIRSSDGTEVLYDLAADPLEQTDRLAAAPEVAEALRRQLIALRGTLPEVVEGTDSTGKRGKSGRKGGKGKRGR